MSDGQPETFLEILAAAFTKGIDTAGALAAKNPIERNFDKATDALEMTNDMTSDLKGVASSQSPFSSMKSGPKPKGLDLGA